MVQSDRANQVVRFGGYEIDRKACELRRHGQHIPLQIQPFRVLEALISAGGDVVTRAELRQKIWPSTIYVDFDHGLNSAMTRLRHALDDSAESPRFIETLPRVGYRFIHPVAHPETTATVPSYLRRLRELRVLGWSTVGLVVIASAVAIGGRIASFEQADDDVPVPNPPTAFPEAHDAYLSGLALLEERNKESTMLGIERLRRATEIDPSFAAAFAALATAYASAGGNNSLPKYLSAEAALPSAVVAAERALTLAPQLADAHAALAVVLNSLQPWSAANDVAIEQSYRRSLELNRSNSSVQLAYGNFLSTRGRSDEAVVRYREARELDPFSPSVSSRLGMELLALGMTGEGLALLRRTVELDPWQFNARWRLGWALIALGDLDAAKQAFETAERISPGSVRSQAALAFVAARQGDAARANELLASIQPAAEALSDPFDVAIIYVGLEDAENSIAWLTKTALQSRTLHMNAPWGIGAPIYDWLRADSRFADLERNIAASTRLGQPVEQVL